ncbi:RXT2-like protein [Pseudoneurospora amorphoporcata]|uniref:RXT2-like protein n=1 Tax=Pseudoneurospora amorphoporcata TaxID=241081 RepID=A0AAN6P4U7_9PEZI|nr:RXT2-like protein [Pseudoneurospora amorphoporcata]
MSTQQQAMIMDTIVSIRKTLKRKAYESDSDTSIDHNTNRGYKLKKRARFVKQGRLANANGPAAYKEVAEHGGYQRAVINQNPPLIDEDGYDIDSDDNEERVQEAISATMEENPYATIRLEQLLAPLTSVTDLPNHPTLSRPFKSKALTELANQANSLSRRENVALWKVKPLLTKFVGDNSWAPCGMMIESTDHDLFEDTSSFIKWVSNWIPNAADAVSAGNNTKTIENGPVDGNENEASATEPEESGQANGDSGNKPAPDSVSDDEHLPDADTHPEEKEETEEDSAPKVNGKKTTDEDVEMAESTELLESAPIGYNTEVPVPNGETSKEPEQAQPETVITEVTTQSADETTKADQPVSAPTPPVDGQTEPAMTASEDVEMANAPNGETGKDQPAASGAEPEKNADQPRHELEQQQQPDQEPQEEQLVHGVEDLRAKANAQRDAALSTVASVAALQEFLDEPYIHPIFLAPRTSHPDRDFGLPEQEAEDVRRLLQLYVQKQEEVCRGTRKLYEGLRKADRYRQTVLSWAKAEAHSGANRDMSDGEDWYDKEEWGLTEDLKKGEDEVEEETAVTQKKTRNRK